MLCSKNNPRNIKYMPACPVGLLDRTGGGHPHQRRASLDFCSFRVRAKITSQNWRSDLVQIWLIRESKTTGIASYFAANFIRSGASEVSAKDGLKLRCKNAKLFLREP